MAKELGLPDTLQQIFRDARRICVLTGAGVSAESGVPTFRDAQHGLWARYDPLQLATPEAFDKNPELVWDWYRWRRTLVAQAQPNPGHSALARMAKCVSELTLITQNVDGLHQRAGSSGVVEFHGNLFVNRCSAPTCAAQFADVSDRGVPLCELCGRPLRPGVVWFGEAIPPAALAAAESAATNCEVFLSVGTAAAVWPAAGLAQSAKSTGATIVEINPDTTELSRQCDFRLPAKSGRLLPELLDCWAAKP